MTEPAPPPDLHRWEEQTAEDTAWIRPRPGAVTYTLEKNRPLSPGEREALHGLVILRYGADQREKCRMCAEPLVLGYTLPDDLWRRVVENYWDILCISCFDLLASARKIDWMEGNPEIHWWPVSGLGGRV